MWKVLLYFLSEFKRQEQATASRQERIADSEQNRVRSSWKGKGSKAKCRIV